MRRFLIANWTLPLSILAWTSSVLAAAVLKQPINAIVALAALVCVGGLTWHAWRHHMSQSTVTAVSAVHPIQAAPVQRDGEGYWTHPAYPPFDEGQGAEAAAWFKAQQLETSIAYLESESEEHPAVVAYWGDDGDSNISAWQPPRPAGDGWFALSIHDTEDWGPVCVWVRHGAQQGKGGEE